MIGGFADQKQKCDVVLFMGQSNMAGRGITCDEWPEGAPVLTPSAAFEYRAVSGPGRLFELTEPFGMDENNPDGIYDVFGNGMKAKTGSMVTAFCNAYYAGTGTPIVAVSASKGGSAIAQWQPEAACGYLRDAIARFCSAVDYLQEHAYSIGHLFAVWCQGETDGDNGTSKTEYIRQFHKMWEELHKVIPDLFLIKIGQCNIQGQYDRYDIIRDAQDMIVAQQKDVHLAADVFYGMREQGLMKDAFHYYQHGYNICGAQAGRSAAEFYCCRKTPQTAPCGRYAGGVPEVT